MSIARDASSPIAVDVTSAANATTASFTAPAQAVLSVCIQDQSTGGVKNLTVDDTGGLTWTKRADNTTEVAEIWTSSATPSSVSRTVTVHNNGTVFAWGFACDAWTGVNPTTPVGATNNGGASTTNNLSAAAITTTAVNSRVIGVAGDDSGTSAGATAVSSDSYNAFNHGLRAYKAANTAGSGTAVTLNFDAPGTSAVAWRWCAIELMEASGLYLPPAIVVPTVAVQRASRW